MSQERRQDDELFTDISTPDRSAPGRAPVTARLAPRPLIFRVESADAARELGVAFGPRNPNGVAAGADVAVQRAAESSGAPLPADVRGRFEGSLGADLGSVRVHTGDASAEAAGAVGARAYTTGQDIHFGAGQYAPTDPFGLHLLAHEVAHTVQQEGVARKVQYKLEVSAPGDALETEADRAADAMVAGRPVAGLSTALAGVGRKIFRDTYGGMQGDGDAAENDAKKKPLQIDTVSVSKDMGDVADTVADITKNNATIKAADDGDLDGRKNDFVSMNSSALAKLSIFNDKLSVTTVDTSAFAVQYRAANTDFQRLNAEAHSYLATTPDGTAAQSGDIDTAAATFNAPKISQEQGAMTQTLLQAFQASRNNLNTAATKMKQKLTTCRGNADGLQSALYKVRAAAAGMAVKADQDKLSSIQAEINETAAGVATVVKLVTAVAGFAGGGAATSSALSGVQQTPTGPTMKDPGSVSIQAANVPGNLQGTSLGAVLAKQQDVDLDPSGTSKLAIAKALYGDAGKLAPGDIGKVDLGGGVTLAGVMSGDPAAIAESLVKAIGTYANKDKIQTLQNDIAAKEAEVSAFSQAAGSLDMASKAELLEGAAQDLATEVKAFADAKKDLNDKADALEANLAKQGKQGQDQAKGIVFLTDADRFLAQVQNAIDVGGNQQANLQKAAEDRKNLRGTDASLEDKDRDTQHYYRLELLGAKPWYQSGKFYYRAERMDVTFTGSGSIDPTDANSISQGGAGTVEGVGSADDSVANRIKQLTGWQAKVTALRTAVQNALFGKGNGAPIVNG